VGEKRHTVELQWGREETHSGAAVGERRDTQWSCSGGEKRHTMELQWGREETHSGAAVGERRDTQWSCSGGGGKLLARPMTLASPGAKLE
jgi:hypothetical protein